MRVHAGSEVSRWFLEGGFVQVRENVVTVLCERALLFDDLDPDTAASEAAAARQEGSKTASELQQRAVVMRRVVSANRTH